jgi:bifunctional non-homologous end joining protein LigD
MPTLEKYKEKRNFKKSPEPSGGKSDSSKLTFVVQKHDASHLHYDFRLEVRGVLKSWAIPKGPSMIAGEKRLAMMVEDHPFDYKNFEGVIPNGNYGAGTVIIWDNGTYETVKRLKDKVETEKHLLHHLYLGELSIVLKGKKLKGAFKLIKANDRKENNSWYLIKEKDKYALKTDVTKRDKSILSKLTIEKVAEISDNFWVSNRKSKRSRKEKEGIREEDIINSVKAKGKKSSYPTHIKPMLSTLVKEPFNDESWLYEVKWDGYRIIAYVKNGNANLFTRNHKNYTHKYEVVSDALSQFPYDCVIDGEIVVMDENGKPSFDLLQNYKGKEQLLYYCFDLLFINQYDITKLKLTERKEQLKKIVTDSNSVLRYSEHFEDGVKLFEEIKKLGLEGIVAKRKDSVYLPGVRSKDWLKITTHIKDEFIIGGWTESDSSRMFKSLLFGYYEDGKLMYLGHAGGGYKEKEMESILNKLKKREINKTPFANEVDTDASVHWVKPELVANIKFATFTKSGKVRKPAIFLGFRDDKNSQEIQQPNKASDAESTKVTQDSNWKVLDKQKITTEDSIIISKHKLKLTNVEKELWKGITKATLIEYYHKVSSFILPHLKDRPLSLHVKYNGPMKEGVYIKDMEGRNPEWSKVFSDTRRHKKKGKRDIIDYLICNDEATLLYVINLGCIDINPWTSNVNSTTEPDYIVIDLDPSDDEFKKVINAANVAKKLFDEYKLKAFCKTSGKSGIHIFLPCEKLSFPNARLIAEKICSEIHQMVPKFTTTNMSISSRGDKLYLDPNQNDYADTVASVYSVRPYHVPCVSTPLEWSEINETLNPRNFTMESIFKRLKSKGDLFSDVHSSSIRAKNSRILNKLFVH